MSASRFDLGDIDWQNLEGFDNLSFFVLNVSREDKIVDIVFRFAAGQKIALHRHVALNHLLVLRGEHILYEPDGSVKERRPTGRYTVSPADQHPHSEGGGPDQDVVILFSIRGTDGAMYEILDDDHSLIVTLGMDDFEALQLGQMPPALAATA